MFATMHKKLVLAGLALLVGGSALATATSVWASGQVHDSNTIDLMMFPATQGQLMHYGVSGSGSGSNNLTVKIQQQKSGGGWKTLVTKTLYMPSDSTTGTFTVGDEFTTPDELCRFRFSRAILTKAIDWQVDYLY